MARHWFGDGRYRYLAHPLLDPIEAGVCPGPVKTPWWTDEVDVADHPPAASPA